MRIEIVLVDGFNLDAAVRTIQHCVRIMPPGFFGRATVITPTGMISPNLDLQGVGIISDKGFLGQDTLAYSQWCVRVLPQYIDADYFMLTQIDGYILNPNLWTDKFLDYDYIGSPWWIGPDIGAHRVGNGGFSIRSRKFANWMAAHSDGCESFLEDVFCCRHMHQRAVNAGLRYAPLQLALRWGLEYTVQDHPKRTLKDVFGFHSIRPEGRAQLLL